MKGDYGVIHIDISHDFTDEEASRLFHEICELTSKRRWRKKDMGVSAHWDGDCEESPHCFGAFLRNRESVVP